MFQSSRPVRPVLDACLAAVLALAACAAPERSGSGRGPDAPTAAETQGDVRPTLEEVFLIPGVHGVPPSAGALSADGSWLLFDWRPVVEHEGRRALAPATGPRLISTLDPAASEHRGVPLEQVLEAAAGPGPASQEGLDDETSDEGDETTDEDEEEDDEEDAGGRASTRRPRLAQAFAPPALSASGADLAVASARRLVLLRPGPSGDPLAWTAEVLLELEPPPPEPEPAGAEPVEPGAEEPSSVPARGMTARRMTAIWGLEFDEPGRALLVRGEDGLELSFALDAPRPWRLEDGRPTSPEFPAGLRPRWSEDRGVAFSPRAPLAWLDPATGAVLEQPAGEVPVDEEQGQGSGAAREQIGDEDAADDDAAEPAGEGEQAEPERVAARIWRRADDRYVALEGYEPEGRAALSPRGGFVVQTVDDESGAPEPTLVPDYLTERVTTRRARRQLADDGAYPSRTWLHDTATGARVELPVTGEPGWWSTPVGWAPVPDPESPERHAWMLMSPDFRTMRLRVWTARGEAPLDEALVQVLEVRDPRWYGGPAAWPHWTPDGRRLVVGLEASPLSLSPDRTQLFAIDVETGATRQLTEVAGEVSSFQVLEDGRVLFTASHEDPRRRVLGVVPAEAVRGATSADRTWARPLEAPTGWNTLAGVSDDGERLVVSHQTLGAPAELWALDTSGEGRPLQLTRTRPASFERIDWIRPVPFEAAHEDGTQVRAHVYLPRSSDLARPDRARPAVVFIHGAGYLQNVTDSMTQYEVNLLFHSRLAALGYVVIDVDYRGSAGYGNAFRTAVQYDLGRLELQDIDLVVDALAARGVVDGGRVACYGGSYGGFLTLMALFTAPERWVAGAALRSVTDWRTYHPRYTQPRLGRPSTHAEAYARSSPIDLAEGLEDPLLILHGMLDSNVFAQDSIRLIERLIDLGKDFDAMLYPSQGHAFEDGMHWLDEYRRIERFLRRHLGAP